MKCVDVFEGSMGVSVSWAPAVARAIEKDGGLNGCKKILNS